MYTNSCIWILPRIEFKAFQLLDYLTIFVWSGISDSCIKAKSACPNNVSDRDELADCGCNSFITITK